MTKAKMAASSYKASRDDNPNLVIATPKRGEAISLPVDRHTAFAMTIYTTLVMTKTRWPRRLKSLLAMTIYATLAMTSLFYA